MKMQNILQFIDKTHKALKVEKSVCISYFTKINEN